MLGHSHIEALQINPLLHLSSRSVTLLPQKNFGLRHQEDSSGSLEPSSGIRVKLQGGSGGSSRGPLMPKTHGVRTSELNWILKDDVKGDLNVSEGIQGPNRKIIYMIYLLGSKNLGRRWGELR